MLNELCSELKNYFCQDKHFGTFAIAGGVITPLDFLRDGQYFRIIGSTFNDGIYQYGQTGVAFKDETFNGAIWALAIPEEFIQLSLDIDNLNNEIAKTEIPKFQSESYPNGYSYSMATALPEPLKLRLDEIKQRKRRWKKL